MTPSKALSGASLVALAAFALTGALSLRAQVEPLYAVLRGIGAFAAILCVARWTASILDLVGPDDAPNSPSNRLMDAADEPRGPARVDD
jgi:hypothetical protein